MSYRRLASQQKLESAQQEIDNHPRWVRWHSDGLLFTASDIARPLALVRSRSHDVGFDVVLTSVVADSMAPACAIEGIFGMYEMPSGPYVALVLESTAINEFSSLRSVTKVGLAPIFSQGRRLNTQMRLDESLEVKMLSRALREHRWLTCPSTPGLATMGATRFSSKEEDDDDDDKFWWNAEPLSRILPAWTVRCARGAGSDVFRVGSHFAYWISRVARDREDFVETELVIDNVYSILFVSCREHSNCCDEAFVDDLLAEYGCTAITLVVSHSASDLRSRGARLASLKNGAKVRMVVGDADDLSNTVRNLAHATKLDAEPSRPVCFVESRNAFDCHRAILAATFAALERFLDVGGGGGSLSPLPESTERDVERAYRATARSCCSGLGSPPRSLLAAFFEGPRRDAATLLKLGGATAIKHKNVKVLLASAKVHALERLDSFAFKVIFLFLLLYAVINYFAGENATHQACQTCALLVVAQALLLVYLPLFINGTFTQHVANTSRFLIHSAQ